MGIVKVSFVVVEEDFVCLLGSFEADFGFCTF